MGRKNKSHIGWLWAVAIFSLCVCFWPAAQAAHPSEVDPVDFETAWLAPDGFHRLLLQKLRSEQDVRSRDVAALLELYGRHMPKDRVAELWAAANNPFASRPQRSIQRTGQPDFRQLSRSLSALYAAGLPGLAQETLLRFLVRTGPVDADRPISVRPLQDIAETLVVHELAVIARQRIFDLRTLVPANSGGDDKLLVPLIFALIEQGDVNQALSLSKKMHGLSDWAARLANKRVTNHLLATGHDAAAFSERVFVTDEEIRSLDLGRDGKSLADDVDFLLNIAKPEIFERAQGKFSSFLDVLRNGISEAPRIVFTFFPSGSFADHDLVALGQVLIKHGRTDEVQRLIDVIEARPEQRPLGLTKLAGQWHALVQAAAGDLAASFATLEIELERELTAMEQGTDISWLPEDNSTANGEAVTRAYLWLEDRAQKQLREDFDPRYAVVEFLVELKGAEATFKVLQGSGHLDPNLAAVIIREQAREQPELAAEKLLSFEMGPDLPLKVGKDTILDLQSAFLDRGDEEGVWALMPALYASAMSASENPGDPTYYAPFPVETVLAFARAFQKRGWSDRTRDFLERVRDHIDFKKEPDALATVAFLTLHRDVVGEVFVRQTLADIEQAYPLLRHPLLVLWYFQDGQQDKVEEVLRGRATDDDWIAELHANDFETLAYMAIAQHGL